MASKSSWLLAPLLFVGCGGSPSVVTTGDAAVDDTSATAVFDTLDETTQLTPDQAPDAAPANPDVTFSLDAGATLWVTATELNLRAGAATTDTVLTTMPCGSSVTVVAGPSDGWWHVTYGADDGWASGTYLVPTSEFDPAVCGDAAVTLTDAASSEAGALTAAQNAIFSRAKLGVGYSYYWGHGSWNYDGASPGSCSGTCPSCTHDGQYGADCSGFVAKCWQTPTPTPITEDLHPYSTYDFYNSTDHWTQIPRAQIQPADALVYNADGEGHIMLFESGGDPWGNIWTYEARGCSTGIVHNLRVADSTYVAIRLEGM